MQNMHCDFLIFLLIIIVVIPCLCAIQEAGKFLNSKDIKIEELDLWNF